MDNYSYISFFAKVYIKGVELDKQRYAGIMDITFTETVNGSDSCTINIADTNGIFIEDNIFLEETPVHVVLGVNEFESSVTFTGYINALDLDFPSSGVIALTLNCADNSHRMNRTKKSRSWSNTTSIDILIGILSEYGFNLKADSPHSFKNYDSKSQDDTTDISFIESMLTDESLPCYAKMYNDNTFVYELLNFTADPKMDLHYKIAPYEVISFKPSITLEQLEEGVTKTEIDLGTKELFTSFASISNPTSVTQGNKVVTTSSPIDSGYNFSGTEQVGYAYRGVTELDDLARSEELQSDAEKELMSGEINTLTGTAELRITPDTVKLRITDTINILGLGKYLSGLYLITDISRGLSTSGMTLSLTVAKTGFGNSAKSSTLYTKSEKVEVATSSGSSSGSVDTSQGEQTTIEFTAYTATGNATASGTMPTSNYTVAAWDDIPFGTQVYVPSRGVTYTVEDRGGAITYGIMDIYMDTEEECLNFGRQQLEAYLFYQ